MCLAAATQLASLEFEIEVSGNLPTKAFTNNTLIDGQRVLERMAVDQFQDGVELINASDGIRIEGWTSMPPSAIKGGSSTHLKLSIRKISSNGGIAPSIRHEAFPGDVEGLKTTCHGV